MYKSNMRILTRYIIKEHIGPFFFGLSIIMFILMMNFLVKYIGDIFGKGLPALTIIKLILFNMPWMMALAVPMATLVAVLMAFGRFSADNEITILKSSGISIYRIIRPSLLLGAMITLIMIWFNDYVLPDANHQAKLMFRAIRHKKPTLQLEEYILYSVGKYTFSVAHIEKPTLDEWVDISKMLGPEYRSQKHVDRLRDLVIFDRREPRKDVTILAKEGYMVYSIPRESIIFTLLDGEYHEFNDTKPDEYQRSLFKKQLVVIPAKEFILEEQRGKDRSDREMNIKMMQAKVQAFRNQAASQKKKIAAQVERNFKNLDALLDSVAAGPEKLQTAEFSFIDKLDEKKWRNARRKAQRQAERQFQQMRMKQGFIDNQYRSVNKYLVEIYKKFSIPFASIVFVLIGAPLGVMARRGNMGVAMSLSIGFFLLYWISLIGGEELSDRELLTPFWAMWSANILVGAAGLYLTWKAVKETSFIDWQRLGRLFKRSIKRTESAPDV